MQKKTVKKAVIPLAGLGTRMFPASKAIKKELFPIVSPDGRCICLLQRILEEACTAGIENIALIVRPGDEKVFSRLFEKVDQETFARLPEFAQKEELKLQEIGSKIDFVFQEEAKGFGHAIYCVREWLAGAPFLLMLSDHIYFTYGKKSCAEHLLEQFCLNEQKSIVSLYPVHSKKVSSYGTVSGKFINDSTELLAINKFVEKPDYQYAKKELQLQAIPEDTFLCVYGQYVLNDEIFPILERNIAADFRQRGEIQLSPVLAELAEAERLLGWVVNGEHYDTGQPLAYAKSFASFAEI